MNEPRSRTTPWLQGWAIVWAFTATAVLLVGCGSQDSSEQAPPHATPTTQAALQPGTLTNGETNVPQQPQPTPSTVPNTALSILTIEKGSNSDPASHAKGSPQAGAENGSVTGDLGAKLDEYLTRITPFGFAGAVLVAKGGEIVINKGYGMADRAQGVPNTAETVFSTGSITKQFTAAGIMALEMQGKLNTYDPISKYLEGVLEDKADVTLHHLLTHTAGVTIYSGFDYDAVHRDETVNSILGEPLKFTPGEKFEYTNSGYTLLAAIIERVSGQPYEEFLHEQLFEPAGMSFTGYRIPNWNERVVAHWYRGDIDNRTPLEKPYPYWNLIGNGAILSTTGDMYRWHLALQGEGILSSDAKKKLFSPFLINYAYGWDVRETEHGTLIEHNGGSMLGNSAEFMRYVDADVVLVLFCNQSYRERALCPAIKDKIEALAFGGDVAIPPSELSSDSPALNAFKGDYRLPSGGRIKATVENGALTFGGVGQDVINALTSPDQSRKSLYEELNDRSVAILEAAVGGDYGPLGQALAEYGPLGEPLRDKQDRLYGARRFIDGLLVRSKPVIGDVQKVKSMGTLRSLSFDDGAVTVVGFEGQHGCVFVGVGWFKGEIVELRPTESGQLVAVPSLPLSDSEFAGYHLGVGNNVRFGFTLADDGLAAGLTVHSEDSAVEASKTESQVVNCE